MALDFRDLNLIVTVISSYVLVLLEDTVNEELIVEVREELHDFIAITGVIIEHVVLVEEVN